MSNFPDLTMSATALILGFFQFASAWIQVWCQDVVPGPRSDQSCNATYVVRVDPPAVLTIQGSPSGPQAAASGQHQGRGTQASASGALQYPVDGGRQRRAAADPIEAGRLRAVCYSGPNTISPLGPAFLFIKPPPSFLPYSFAEPSPSFRYPPLHRFYRIPHPHATFSLHLDPPTYFPSWPKTSSH